MSAWFDSFLRGVCTDLNVPQDLVADQIDAFAQRARMIIGGAKLIRAQPDLQKRFLEASVRAALSATFRELRMRGPSSETIESVIDWIRSKAAEGPTPAPDL